MTRRARWGDIETVSPSDWGPGGGYRIFCPGGCDLARHFQKMPIWGHRYTYGHTKTSALAMWRIEHPRENGDSK